MCCCVLQLTWTAFESGGLSFDRSSPQMAGQQNDCSIQQCTTKTNRRSYDAVFGTKNVPSSNHPPIADHFWTTVWNDVGARLTRPFYDLSYRDSRWRHESLDRFVENLNFPWAVGDQKNLHWHHQWQPQCLAGVFFVSSGSTDQNVVETSQSRPRPTLVQFATEWYRFVGLLDQWIGVVNGSGHIDRLFGQW